MKVYKTGATIQFYTNAHSCPLLEREMGIVERDGFAERDNWTVEEGEEECWVGTACVVLPKANKPQSTDSSVQRRQNRTDL